MLGHYTEAFHARVANRPNSVVTPRLAYTFLWRGVEYSGSLPGFLMFSPRYRERRLRSGATLSNTVLASRSL